MKLLRRLHDLQTENGYLTEAIVRDLAREERVPLYRLQELVSFYPHFRATPPPRTHLAVCRDVSCWLAGAPRHFDRLKTEATNRPDCHVSQVSCLGRCDAAPAAHVNGRAVALRDDTNLSDLEANSRRESPVPSRARKVLCDPYDRPEEWYGAFRALAEMNRTAAADAVLAALKESGLRGMGGAGFPTATKWDLVRRETRTPKYVICNADESEPGTFKDREILARLSHLVLEGMLIAALTTGATRGILYIRHEYEPERQAFETALDDLRIRGLVGPKSSIQDFDFDIEIFVSPGGYILGEETALLEALEDKRGEPRNKPPYPVTHGLYGQPTLINNVETFAMAPGILRMGPAAWRALGRPGFAGLKFIAVSGRVARPGVYEIAVGTTVRELLQLAGGMVDDKPLLAFTPGGASSAFLPASAIDVPLDFTALAQAGSMLGSGALIFVAEGTDLFAMARNVVEFFRNESCGKCVPCRIGTQKAVEMLQAAQAEPSKRVNLSVLTDLHETLSLTSICGLGQVALTPIMSVTKHFGEHVSNVVEQS